MSEEKPRSPNKVVRIVGRMPDGRTPRLRGQDVLVAVVREDGTMETLPGVRAAHWQVDERGADAYAKAVLVVDAEIDVEMPAARVELSAEASRLMAGDRSAETLRDLGFTPYVVTGDRVAWLEPPTDKLQQEARWAHLLPPGQVLRNMRVEAHQYRTNGPVPERRTGKQEEAQTLEEVLVQVFRGMAAGVAKVVRGTGDGRWRAALVETRP